VRGEGADDDRGQLASFCSQLEAVHDNVVLVEGDAIRIVRDTGRDMRSTTRLFLAYASQSGGRHMYTVVSLPSHWMSRRPSTRALSLITTSVPLLAYVAMTKRCRLRACRPRDEQAQLVDR
jgi:hypothetical protein